MSTLIKILLLDIVIVEKKFVELITSHLNVVLEIMNGKSRSVRSNFYDSYNLHASVITRMGRIFFHNKRIYLITNLLSFFLLFNKDVIFILSHIDISIPFVDMYLIKTTWQ